jgi:Ni,Fe-hydrogenase I small subunit
MEKTKTLNEFGLTNPMEKEECSNRVWYYDNEYCSKKQQPCNRCNKISKFEEKIADDLEVDFND